ncbi:unnamed protein product, partial [Staurois parvus]
INSARHFDLCALPETVSGGHSRILITVRVLCVRSRSCDHILANQ